MKKLTVLVAMLLAAQANALDVSLTTESACWIRLTKSYATGDVTEECPTSEFSFRWYPAEDEVQIVFADEIMFSASPSTLTVAGTKATSATVLALLTAFESSAQAACGSSATPAWGSITSKPFSTIGTGLTVTGDALSAIATSPAWETVTGKPFSTIGTGLTVTGDALSAIATSPAWETVTGKPFSTIGTDLVVTNDAIGVKPDRFLSLDTQTEAPTVRLQQQVGAVEKQMLLQQEDFMLSASNMQDGGKIGALVLDPLSASLYVESGSTLNGVLIDGDKIRVTAPLVTTSLSASNPSSAEFITKEYADANYKDAAPAWTVVTGKPFNSIGDRLTVTDGVLSSDKPTWETTAGKPFNSIGTGLTVGTGYEKELKLDYALWQQVIMKPFTTIGTGLTVTDDVLSAEPAATPAWSDITSKPFTTIGTGLTVENDALVNPSETWTSVLDKPFTSIGTGLAVMRLPEDEYQLYVSNDVYPNWNNVTGKPFTKFGSVFHVYENGVVDIDDGTFVKASSLADSMKKLPSIYAQLNERNSFTGSNTFIAKQEKGFSVETDGGSFDIAGGELMVQLNNSNIYIREADMSFSYGEGLLDPAKIVLENNNNVPRILIAAPAGILFQNGVEIALGKKLGYGDDSENYPTPVGDNEYITKGWADQTYGGQSSGTPEWSNVQHKPFASIGTGLTVTDNVLSAASTVPAWSDVTSKPFSTIGAGLTVTGDALSATASTPTWSTTTGKPFSTIGAGLTVTSDALSATPTWSTTTEKPFNSLGTNLSVSNNVLNAATPTWSATTGKPFSTVGTGLSISNDELSVAATTPAWSDVTSKPFSTIGTGLSVTGSVLSATAATPTWSATTGKPFSTIGAGLTVTGDALSATASTPTWSTTTGKPFSTIGVGLDVIDGALAANPPWDGIANKPFNTIGTGLSVDGYGVLSADVSGDFMKLAGGNTFTGAQTGTLANYEAFKLTGSGTNQMYFNLTPGRDFRAGDNNTFVNVDSSSVSLFANSGTNYATFYAYPAGNIFTRADKGFVMDGDVVINTGHKLGWNSVSSSMYPTPTTNSEYVTKGWTDLTYAKKGGVGWSDVTSKPFNTLGTGFYITDGALNADYANPPWSYIRNKPFSTIGDGLSVTDGVLSATGGGGSTTWDNVTEKPFSSIGTGLNVVDGALNTESAAPLWSSVGRKPFSTIGKGLVVAGDELQADASEVLYRYDNVGSSDVRLRRFVAGELNIELNMLSSNNSANLVASDLELDRLAMVQAYTSANLMLAVRNPPSKYTYINLRDSTIELFSGYACAHLINTGSSFAYIKENEYIVKAWADSKYAFKNGELAGTSASWHDVVQYLILFALVIERIVSLRRKSKKSVL